MTAALTPSVTAAVTAAVNAAVHAAADLESDAGPRAGGTRGATGEVGTALRLGWAMAEARGRSWPKGPQPAKSTKLPMEPQDLLPLRSQREEGASRTEAVSTLVALATRLRLDGVDDLHAKLEGQRDVIDEKTWQDLATKFKGTDSWIQDALAQRDDGLANGYLLGRGLAECWWGLDTHDRSEWHNAKAGASPAFLFGDERLRELSRMLGRLQSPDVHELSPSAIDGSLQAWGAVAKDQRWLQENELPARLYEQARAWYQLLVLGQDPTTLIRPDARLGGFHYLGRTLRAFWPQLVLAVGALAFTAVILIWQPDVDHLDGLTPVLATGGFGAFALAGLLARGKSAAQRMLARLRQDAYTDLVALSVTVVPDRPPGGSLKSLESLVRDRLLTPPTPAPPA